MADLTDVKFVLHRTGPLDCLLLLQLRPRTTQKSCSPTPSNLDEGLRTMKSTIVTLWL